MKAFELHEARSVEDAVALLGKYNASAKIIAGGSDLLGMMKDQITGPSLPYPEHLVDVSAIPEFATINRVSDGLRVGAGVTLADLEASSDVNAAWSLLAQAAASAASPLIRNFGTLGGNINQRPRCWYFRGTQFNDCYKRGGDFCFAVTGKNAYHAIIGGELCYFVHPSDTATALVAMNASAKLAGPDGQRTVPFEEYFVGPREDVLRENVLKPGEVLVEVLIPTPPANTRSAWIKVKSRQVYDFAVASVAVAFTEENGTWKDGRIVLGGVAPKPYRATGVEEALQGKSITDNIDNAVQRLTSAARPMSDNAYKVTLAEALIKQAILKALA
ncbi:MAG: xanthine dehydrogenase family protein subunit M [Ardenticatenaceae bacterium]|nr:xanthine dehydrogenase family protein subunit M [Ardenticatenaceae bacterium]HBY94090.1 molybdopterin dehydrogenase [Chloroflexota bacterium]